MIIGQKDNEMVSELSHTINERDQEIALLKDRIKNLEKELDGIKKERYEQIAECSFEIDFKEFNVFSIERMEKPKEAYETFNREVTNIGYLIDGKPKEWIFYCTRETHEKIVEKYKSYISLRNQA